MVDDSKEEHQGCVALERLIADFNYDTQNFIFDYQAIRNGEGYCSTEDPLYDKSAPCSDLEKELVMVKDAGRRRLAGRTEGGKSMYTRGDMSRADMIDQGWPWETSTKDIIFIAVGVTLGVALVAAAALVVWRKRKNKGVQGRGNSNAEQVDGIALT